jgi:poly(A) polymerase
VDDIDIATGATPDRVMAIDRGGRAETRANGIDHGTITVVSPGCRTR